MDLGKIIISLAVGAAIFFSLFYISNSFISLYEPYGMYKYFPVVFSLIFSIIMTPVLVNKYS